VTWKLKIGGFAGKKSSGHLLTGPEMKFRFMGAEVYGVHSIDARASKCRGLQRGLIR
jgi:hypothetical protein